MESEGNVKADLGNAEVTAGEGDESTPHGELALPAFDADDPILRPHFLLSLTFASSVLGVLSSQENALGKQLGADRPAVKEEERKV